MSSAELYKILFYTSIVVWLIPPFRQYKGKFFFFFLILALMDPVVLAYSQTITKASSIQLTTFFVFLLFISVLPHELIKKNKSLFIALSVLIIIMAFFGLNHAQNFVLLILLHSSIFLIILKIFITNYVQLGKVSLFYLIFIFYELTNILKLLNVLLGFADAIGLFILTTIAQIIFGLFFSVYKEDKTGNAV